MPAWLITIAKVVGKFILDRLVEIAIAGGVPALAAWVNEKAPWYVRWLLPSNFAQMLIEYLNQIKEIKVSTSLTPAEKEVHRAVAVVRTKQAVRAQVRAMGPRIGVASETKGLD